ncbi:DUF4097 family beta strand repeat-containing protein [Luteococcus peritonei]|uniref:DUF4097 domain-containing protein n=1 Tax=Luteococcus peritonei TaxID=88874 RepID=A0ABW4RVC0_9ACTN
MTTQTEPTTTATTHPFTPGMRLDLVASEADVELFFDRTTPEAEVVITASEPAYLEHSLKTSRSDDRLEVVVPPLLTAGPEKGFALQIGRFSLSLGHTAGVTVEVHLPAGSAVRVDGGSGDLRLEGRPGTVQLDTRSGDITLDVLEAGQLRSASGDITVDEIAAERPVTLASSSGDLAVERCTGPVELGTSSGDITLSSMGAGELTARTSSGDITVGVVAGLPVWQELSTASGDLDNRLSSRGEPVGGAPRLQARIRTASGDLSLHDA